MEQALNLIKTYVRQDLFLLRNVFTAANEPEKIGSRTIRATSSQVARSLAAVAVLLLAASVVSDVANIQTGLDSPIFRRLATAFSVDRELNIPAFFSMSLLLFSSVLLGCIAFLNYDGRLSSLRYWGILALGFVWMAFDEITSVHERLIEPVRVVLGGENLGIFYFAWVVPGILVVLACAGWFLRFWSQLPRKTRILFFVAGGLFLAGALGVELIDGSYAEIYGRKTVVYTLLSAVEEALEMAGVIVFIKALLDYIGNRFQTIELSFDVAKKAN